MTSPILAWFGGKTNTDVRDVPQRKLLGPSTALGTGLVRKDLLVKTIKRPGIPDAIETIHVKHIPTGRDSVGVFKSYEQGWESWAGSVVDFVWLDEEPLMRLYSEALMRTINAEIGRLILTFTPLKGWTDVVNAFLRDESVMRG